MSISNDDLGRITQQTHVVSSDGERLGSVNQVYTSDTTGDPAWITVKTGLFGTQESFVPLSDASFDGDDVRVGVTKEAVHDAPRVDSDGHLTPEEEDELYRHYGVRDPDGSAGDDRVDQVGDGDGDANDGREHGTATAGTAAAAGAGLGAATTHDRDPDRDEVGDEGGFGDRDDRVGDDRTGDDGDADGSAGRDAVAAGAGAGVGGAAGSALGEGFGRDRTDDQTAPRHAAPDPDDRSVAAENGPEHVEGADTRSGRPGQSGEGGPGGQEGVRPGERTTRLRRYVVTERVVQTIEELPDEDGTSR